jgi:hypothetical protein
MRRKIPFAAILLLVALGPLMMNSCKEVGPDIDLGNGPVDTSLLDTTYVSATIDTQQTKSILIEDFTGVRCKNCPTGAAQARSIEALYPGRVVIVAQHSEFLAEPYAGDPDLRTTFAQDIEDLLAPSLGKPSAAIDRRVYSGEQNILIAQTNKWANYAGQAIGETTPVNIYIESEYADSNRSLLLTVTLHYTQAVANDNRISVMLTEDNITANQLQPNDDIDSTYIQEHVLRTMLTRFNGETIDATKEPGRVIIREFKLNEVPLDWNPDEMHAVVLVHESGSSFKVLQVQSISIK